MKFRNIYHDSTSKLLRWIAALLAIGVVLTLVRVLVIHPLALPWAETIEAVFEELSIAFFCSAILAMTIDVGFRRELLNDIEGIFKGIPSQNFISSTVINRQELNNLISSDVANAKPGETINTIGVTEGTFFTIFPGNNVVKEKIQSGCHFRILVLHPDSKLLECIQNESRYYGTLDLRASLGKAMGGVINLLVTDLLRIRTSLRGSLEIRMHKDLLSSGYYYSSNSIAIFSPYLAHKRGTLCPAFLTRNRGYETELSDHFSALWRQSEHHLLVKVDRSAGVDNTTAKANLSS